MPQLRVDVVGKVDGGCSGRQLSNVALGGVHKHLVTEDVCLDGLQELVGGGDLPLPFQQLTQPSHLLLKLAVLGVPFLVRPVGGHAVLGQVVHLKGADLDFQRNAPLAHHRCV